MKFASLISQPIPITEEDAKVYMNEHPTGAYQLVDVRQPGEYAEDHLPGAKLVPLNLLTEGEGELNPEKPTIVYCRSGGRSRAAAQYLSGQGFKEVYDIGTNIQTWMGTKAVGDYELSLDLINPEVDFPDAFALSYAMEEGLKQFYLALDKAESRDEFKSLYQKLAGFEDLHKKRLLEQSGSHFGGDLNPEQFLEKNRDAIEGGELVKSTPVSIAGQMKNVVDILGLSMAIEAQSLDLYTRLAEKSTEGEVRSLFRGLADEEKQHMVFISKELDKYLEKQ